MPVDALSVANFPIPAVPSTKVPNWRGTGSTNGVIGSGGVIPSQWSMSGTGLSFEILGHGIDATTNVEYTDIRAFGTASGNISYRLSFAPSNLIDCLYDDRYQTGFYLALLAGGTGLTNVGQHQADTQFRRSDGTSVSTGVTNIAAPDSTFKLYTTIHKATGGANPVLIAKADPEYQFAVANGLTIDYRFRIGYPIGVRAAESGIGFPLNSQNLAPVESCQSNGVTNPTGTGVVTGSPGTAPTKWQFNIPAGLTRTIVQTITVDGVPCIDVRWNGTITPAGWYPAIFEDNVTVVGALNDQMRQSTFLAIVGGSLANVNSIVLDNVQYPAGNDNTGSDIKSQLTAGLKEFTFQAANFTAGTNFVQPRVNLSCNAGVAIDLTFRFGLPRFNKANFWRAIAGPDLAQNAALTQKHVLVALAFNNSSPVLGQPGVIYLVVWNITEAADSAAFVLVFEGQRADRSANRSRPTVPTDHRPASRAYT